MDKTPPVINLGTSACVIRPEGEKRCQTRVFRVSETGTTPPVMSPGSLCMRHQELKKGRRGVPADQSVPGIINGHQTPPGVEVDHLDVLIIMGTEGVPDPEFSGYQKRAKTPPPVTNLEHLGILVGTEEGEKGCQTGEIRVSNRGTRPLRVSTWTFLIVKTHQISVFLIYI
ncbi:unnamed protein product [Sphagnum balticum]